MNTKILITSLAVLVLIGIFSFKTLSTFNSGQRSEEYAIVTIVGEGKRTSITVSREDETTSTQTASRSSDTDDVYSSPKPQEKKQEPHTLLKTLGDLNKEGFELIDSNWSYETTGTGNLIVSQSHQTFVLRKKLK